MLQLFLGWGVTIVAAAEFAVAERLIEPSTNIAELRQLAKWGKRVICPVNLTGVICWRDPASRRIALQDDSGEMLLTLDQVSSELQPGCRVTLKGACAVDGESFSVGQTPVVENDGIHAQTERAGTIYLRTGKHPIRVCWFDGTGQYSLDVAYAGPSTPRQTIPARALYHAVPTPSGTNWVRGLSYRAYEGEWDFLPDFSQCRPVREGFTEYFDFGVRSRTNDVGIEFTGYLDVPRDGLYTFWTSSDDGSRLFIDQQLGRLDVIGAQAVPTPRDLSVSQTLSDADEYRWSQVEGRVTFVGATKEGWMLELNTRSGAMNVILTDTVGMLSSLFDQAQVRARGICQAVTTLDGRRVPGKLQVNGLDQIEVLAASPEAWSRYVVVPIADLPPTPPGHFAQGIAHLRGRVRLVTASRGVELEDSTGRVVFEPSIPGDVRPGGLAEALGTWRRAGTNIAFRCGLFRTIAERQDPGADSLPMLTTIEQIHRLKRAEAERRYPVLIRGVVTCAWTWNVNGILQDSTRGIFVTVVTPTNSAGARVGDYLEVKGLTGPGDFAPVIESSLVTRLGSARLPDPVRPTWGQLMNGSMDMQFVEIEGIVASTQSNFFNLRMPQGKIQVEVEDFTADQLKPFENAHVRLRGCLSAVWDGLSHQVKSGHVFLHTITISLVEAPPQDLFAVQLKRVEELRQFDALADAFQRVRVSGQIVHFRNGEYYLMDGTNGLRCTLKEQADLHLGDQVELAGFPELGDCSPLVREAVARKTGQASLPDVQILAAENLLRGSYDATRVQIDSRLVGLRSNETDRVLELQMGPRTYLARLQTSAGPVPLLRLGSRLRLTGVYSGQGGDPAAGRDIDSFELLLNSPADIQVLACPSWWTTGRTWGAIGGLASAVLLAGCWILSLRHQVGQQTRELKVEIEEHRRTGAELAAKGRSLAEEIEERKRFELEVERIHKQLLTISRKAGMAEVATSVLHNVGNVLNNIAVSTSVVISDFQHSKLSGLPRVAALLAAHAQEPNFLNADEKGKQLPDYLKCLAEQLASEQAANLKELEGLRKNVEQIEGIVVMQEKYARLGGIAECVKASDIVEDAIRINLGVLAQHAVVLTRDYEADPELFVEKARVLQILVNLIENAKDACADSRVADGQLTLRILQPESQRVRIQVIDNGIGISAENLKKVFSQGFTTRQNGGGFGLHGCLNTAIEMHGSLTVASEGVGQGATFTLQLPVKSAPASGSASASAADPAGLQVAADIGPPISAPYAVSW